MLECRAWFSKKTATETDSTEKDVGAATRFLTVWRVEAVWLTLLLSLSGFSALTTPAFFGSAL